MGAHMNPWICALLISVAGALGGIVNALVTDNGFLLPYEARGTRAIWCPGFISNILVGAFAAFSSWAFYGSGAGIELGGLTERAEISLRFSALAGAFLVGVAGARWITNEADKLMLKESVKVASATKLRPEDCQNLIKGSARQILGRVQQI
jgi:hypothetical protein